MITVAAMLMKTTGRLMVAALAVYAAGFGQPAERGAAWGGGGGGDGSAGVSGGKGERA